MTKLNSVILYPNQSYFIWKVSWLSLISSIYAISQGYNDLAIVPGGVFLTSINYWRDPDYSWRRTLYMNYVRVALSYQLIRSYNSEYAIAHFLCMVAAVSCFPIGWNYYANNQWWRSVYIHSMIHILGNIGNIVLYSGKIEPIEKNPILKFYYIETHLKNPKYNKIGRNSSLVLWRSWFSASCLYTL